MSAASAGAGDLSEQARALVAEADFPHQPKIHRAVGLLIRMAEALDAAAPAPLDPGNPEHLRQVRDFLGDERTRKLIRLTEYEAVRIAFAVEADRLDREQREAEQDASGRKRAEEFIREQFPDHLNSGGPALIEAWIRAERARQKAGQ